MRSGYISLGAALAELRSILMNEQIAVINK